MSSKFRAPRPKKRKVRLQRGKAQQARARKAATTAPALYWRTHQQESVMDQVARRRREAADAD